MEKKIKIGCIGTGTMGGALMEAISKKISDVEFFVSDADKGKATAFAQKLTAFAPATAKESNKSVAESATYIFLAVKPAYIKDVLKEIKDSLDGTKVLVSIAAGVPLSTISDAISAETKTCAHIVRIMPNLPATVGEAMIALTSNPFVTEEEKETVKTLLQSAGKVEAVPEKLMDAVTAISGSGPAYAFLFIEALADAAVRFGMPRAQAYIYAAQTLKGAASLALEDSRSISELKDAVCSPSGTTIEGVIALEKNAFRSSVIEAATAAYNKSVQLSKV